MPSATITFPGVDSQLAGTIKRLLGEGQRAKGVELFDELVLLHQRRASRIAYHYLRDLDEVDETVQDAFVKAFSGLASFHEDQPFEAWFTRILINTCLDRRKARGRRSRRFVNLFDTSPGERDGLERLSSPGPSPEESVLAAERREQIAGALAQLPGRQRTVFILSHYDGCSSREVGEITGLQQSTVRVHLFRAIRRLRALLATGVESEVRARRGRAYAEPTSELRGA